MDLLLDPPDLGWVDITEIGKFVASFVEYSVDDVIPSCSESYTFGLILLGR